MPAKLGRDRARPLKDRLHVPCFVKNTEARLAGNFFPSRDITLSRLLPPELEPAVDEPHLRMQDLLAFPF